MELSFIATTTQAPPDTRSPRVGRGTGDGGWGGYLKPLQTLASQSEEIYLC